MNLTTDTDLANDFGIDVEKLHKLRKQHRWPHVKLGRFDIRFTDLQVEQIVSAMSVTPISPVGKASGLTSRSAAQKQAS